MALPTRPAQGFTRTKLLVVIVVIAVLAVPYVTGILARNQMQARMNDARQIYLAAFSLANDTPGDLKAAGRIANLSDYVTLLVRGGCLNVGDLKAFSGPGYKPYKGTLSNGALVPPFTEENCAYKVYLAKKDDTANTVFLESKNGDKGFIICRKGGDAGIYKTAASAHTFPHPGGGTVESAENCLNPGPAAP